MKTFYFSGILMLTSLSAFCQNQMQTKNQDTIWVVVNHVKADKRDQYETFVNKVFWPGASKLSAADQKVFKQTRLMHGFKPDGDGTYPYMFIMDPVIPGGNYDILPLLTKMFGAAKAEEYFKSFKDATVGESTNYEVLQTKL